MNSERNPLFSSTVLMRRKGAGFTLIELLVALAIMGTVSAMAFGGLRAILNVRNHTDEMAERVAQLQRGMSVMQRDFEQAITRPQRDYRGDVQPAMLSEEGKAIQFTRTGHPNPALLRRSAMQRVAYELRDKTLYRITWLVLDGATEEQMREVALIHNITDMEIRFLGFDDQWNSNWPLEPRDDTSIWLLPKAVSVTLNVEWTGPILRIYRTSGIRPSQPQTGETQ